MAALALPWSMDGRMRLVLEVVKAAAEAREKPEVEELETEEVVEEACLGCFRSCDFGG